MIRLHWRHNNDANFVIAYPVSTITVHDKQWKDETIGGYPDPEVRYILVIEALERVVV